MLGGTYLALPLSTRCQTEADRLVTSGVPQLVINIRVHVMDARIFLAENFWQVWRAGAVLLQLECTRLCTRDIN